MEGTIFRSRSGDTCRRPLDYVAPEDDHQKTTTEFPITAHGTTKITVVYTNDPEKVKSILKMYEHWLEIDERRFGMKFVGLDLEYTRSKVYTGEERQVAVIQLAMRQHVLVFHFCRCDMYPVPALVDFLQHKGIKFTTVDITSDTLSLDRAGIQIPPGHHIDIQDLYQTGERRTNGDILKAGMALIASEIIDDTYLDMKKVLSKYDHSLWEWKPLPQKNLHYAAIDGYLSYEIYSRIRIMNLRQRHLQVPAPAPMEVVCTSCKRAASSVRVCLFGLVVTGCIWLWCCAGKCDVQEKLLF